jgi:hypothetical protein
MRMYTAIDVIDEPMYTYWPITLHRRQGVASADNTVWIYTLIQKNSKSICLRAVMD